MKEHKLENAFENIDMKTGKRVVYLVADKRHERYAHLLQTLISAKRENLKCAIYTTEVYRANMAKASSDNVIIFVGDNPISNAMPKVKNQATTKFGLFYGWYGTRAKLATSSVIWWPRLYAKFVAYHNNLSRGLGLKIRSYPGTELIHYVLPQVPFIGIPLLKRNEINRQQFTACVMLFVTRGLDDFLASVFDG